MSVSEKRTDNSTNTNKNNSKTSGLLVKDIIALMEEIAPPSLALAGDPVGLQAGDPQASVENILVCLDFDRRVLEEAVRLNANLVISHHPLLYQPLKSLDYSRPHDSLIKDIILSGINVYSAHTNLDIVPAGVNGELARLLKLQDCRILEVTGYDELLKLVVFVPEEYADEVREALSLAGAGWIGNYSHCTFQSAGTGTFLPRDGADPFLGRVGDMERVAEFRMETIFPASLRQTVLKAMTESHPYEEAAYDLYPLQNEGIPRGLGLTGQLEKPATLHNFARRCREVLPVDFLKVYGEADREVRQIAVCGGSGGKLLGNAIKTGADVYVTGDLGHHDLMAAYNSGLALIDAGHRGTEYPIVPRLAAWLQESSVIQKSTCRVNTTTGSTASKGWVV